MTKFDIIFTILILIIFGFIGCYFVKTNQNLRVLQNELSYLKNESLALKVSDSTLDQTFHLKRTILAQRAKQPFVRKEN